MTYRDLLDFNNQIIVDEVYKKYKEKCDNQELNQAYHEISSKNQSKLQSAQFKYYKIKDFIFTLIDIIWSLIFAILFIVGGSLLLSVIVSVIHVAAIESLGGGYNSICQIGIFVHEKIFRLSSVELLQGIENYAFYVQSTILFYIIGMTFIFVIIFTVLFILSFFKKNLKEQKEYHLSLEESYHCFQSCEDDDWQYMKTCFERRYLKRKNKDFKDKYLYSYIHIFDHYQKVEGNVDDLDNKEKISLYFYTFVNAIKNVLGSLSMPIYLSIAIIIAYYRTFTYTNLLTLEILLQALPLGNQAYALLGHCYNVVMSCSMFAFLNQFDVELAKIISFCIIFTMIWFIYDVFNRKVREIKRQYHRRLNFYLKKQKNIYNKEAKYKKVYNYSIEFFVFVLFIIICLFYQFSK